MDGNAQSLSLRRWALPKLVKSHAESHASLRAPGTNSRENPKDEPLAGSTPGCPWPPLAAAPKRTHEAASPLTRHRTPLDTGGWLFNDSPSAGERTCPFHSAICTAPAGAWSPTLRGRVLVSPLAGARPPHPHLRILPGVSAEHADAPGAELGPHLRLLLPWLLVALELHGGSVLPPPQSEPSPHSPLLPEASRRLTSPPPTYPAGGGSGRLSRDPPTWSLCSWGQSRRDPRMWVLVCYRPGCCARDTENHRAIFI